MSFWSVGSGTCPETVATPAAQKPQGLQGPLRNLENLAQRQSLGAYVDHPYISEILVVTSKNNSPRFFENKLWIQPFSHQVVEAVRRRSKLWRSDPSRSRSLPWEEGSCSLFLCLFHLPAKAEIWGSRSRGWCCWDWLQSLRMSEMIPCKNFCRSAPLSGPFLWCYSIQSLPCQRRKRSWMQSARQEIMHSFHV